jgi:transposase
MQLQVILNLVERQPGFVYEQVKLARERRELEVRLRARANGQPTCSGCGRKAPGYDRQPERRFQFVPLWSMAVWLVYAPRRVNCPRCGVKVERLPWARGKERTCLSFQWFLAGWAKRINWQEAAQAFGTSWDTVFRAVKMAVCWGLRHRDTERIEAIGVDEIAYRKGHQYLTVVYQIDQGERRLLWVGEGKRKRTLRRFFRLFGKRCTQRLKFICSDMLRSYLSVIAECAPAAVHVLDRFHIMQLFNKAIDKVRAEEARRLKRRGFSVLKKTRWLLLKRRFNLTRKEVLRLKELLAHNLKTVKCYLMKEDFQRLWEYKSPWRIAYFFEDWIERAKRTRIEPIKKLARTLEGHAELIFNWHLAKGEISAGAVEAMNSKCKLTTRRAYGFRAKNTLKYALYHNLGNLPHPDFTHRFC